MASPVALIEVLQEQLRLALEREQQTREDSPGLLTTLEAEQTARRDLQIKPLPVPRKEGKRK